MDPDSIIFVLMIGRYHVRLNNILLIMEHPLLLLVVRPSALVRQHRPSINGRNARSAASNVLTG